MNTKEGLNRRLHSHRLSAATRCAAPHEAVAWFGAMQAQDCPPVEVGRRRAAMRLPGFMQGRQ
jgi:hypothetical protein